MLERKLNRMPGFDYSQPGAYFVTICVYGRECVFGRIVNRKMVLNPYGEIARQCWVNLPNHLPDSELDEFIIMPNHVHGIIWVVGSVGNRHACSLPNPRSLPNDKRDRKRPHQRLPVMIGSFKSAVSKLIHDAGFTEFRWQKSFYDRIIRNEQSLHRIRQYIKENPQKWESDIENSDLSDWHIKDHYQKIIVEK